MSVVARYIWYPVLGLVAALLCCSPVYAQATDSLEAALPAASGKIRTDLLNELSLQYLNHDLARSFKYGEAALAHAIQLSDDAGRAAAYRNLGRAYAMKNDYAPATDYLLRSSRLAAQTGDRVMLADNTVSLAHIYYALDQIDKVYAYDLKAYKLFRELGNIRGESNALMGIGIVYSEEKKYDSALAYYKRALVNYEKLKLNRNLGMTNMNIGSVYMSLGQNSEAEQYYAEALANFKADDGQRGIAAVLQNLSALHRNEGDFKKAHALIDEALQIRTAMGDRGDIADCWKKKASIYQLEGHDALALAYFKRCIPTLEEFRHFSDLAEVYLNMAKIAEARRQYKDAYQYGQAAAIANDSSASKEKTERVHRMEIRHAIEEKEDKIAQLKHDSVLQAAEHRQDLLKQGFLIVLTVVLVILIAILFDRYKKKKEWADILQRKNDWIDSQKKRIEQANLLLELQALRSKLDPHLVFNVLNGARNFIRTADPDKAEEYIGHTAKFIRTALQYASSDWVSMAEELEFTEHYLKIEMIRFPGAFTYYIEAPETIGDMKVPFMLLQPYVENAVLHGISKKSGDGGRVTITVTRQDDELLITIVDNGPGRSVNTLKEPGVVSMGSRLAQGRLDKLSAVSGNQMTVNIEDLYNDRAENAGTCVKIRLVQGRPHHLDVLNTPPAASA